MNLITKFSSFAKRILLIALFLSYFSSLTGLAQEKTSPPVSIGFNVGLNHSTFKFEQRSVRLDLPEYSRSKLGVGLGLILVVPVIKNVSIQPEYIWNNMGGVIKDLDADYHLNYLSFPVMLNWKIFPRFSIVAGPQFDLLINARLEKGGEITDITKEIENRGVNAALGLQYGLTGSISINGRYVHGLNHIGFLLQSITPEYQSRLFQLSIIYYLSL